MNAEVLNAIKLPSGALLLVGTRKVPFETAEIRTLGPPEIEMDGLKYRPTVPLFYSLVVNDETLLTTRRFNLEQAEDVGVFRAIFELEDCVYVSDSFCM